MTSSEHPGEPESGTPPPARPKGAGRFQTGVRGLIVAVACCGVISWAARSARETLHPALAEARRLRSSNPSDRVEAARRLDPLGMVDPGRAIPPLIAALRDPEAEVRIEACKSLGVIGGEAIRTGSAGDEVRAAVAGLIGTMKDPKPAIRIAATRAIVPIVLAKGSGTVIDVPAVITALVTMLSDRDDEVRLNALYAQMNCGPSASADPPAPLVAVLEDRSARNRAMAVRALAAFPRSLDPWLAPLLRRAEDSEPEVVRACWDAFARSRPPAFSAEAIPRLVAALGSRSRAVRYIAAGALSPHASDRRTTVAIPALLTLLREEGTRESHPTRWDAAALTGFGGDPANMVVSLLGQFALRSDAAGDIITALTEVLRSGDPFRRMSAANALGKIGPAAEPAIPSLIRLLRADLAGEAWRGNFNGPWVVQALGRIAPGTKSADDALAVLIEALDLPSEGRAASYWIPQMHLAIIEAVPAFGAAAARALPRLRAFQKAQDPPLKAAADKAVIAIEGAGSGTAGRAPEPVTQAGRRGMP
jgi:HEAT repeat protein